MSDDVSNVPKELRDSILKQAADLEKATPVEPATIQEASLEQQGQYVLRKLTRYLQTYHAEACPTCGSPERSVYPALSFSNGEMDATTVPPIMPWPQMMPVGCQRCGTVRFFASAAVMQIPED